MNHALKEIKNRLLEAQALAQAWRDLKRYHKKNGENFSTIAKNYEYGAVRAKKYTPYGEKEITVTTQQNGRYISDSIDISPTIYAKSQEAKTYEQAGRLIERGEFLHPYINNTPEEIDEKIAARVAYYNKIAKEASATIAEWDYITERIEQIRTDATTLLKNIPQCAFYSVRDALTQNL